MICISQTALNEAEMSDALEDLRSTNYLKIYEKIISLNHCDNNCQVLEVGSSYGWFLGFLEEKNIKCIGVEPSKKAVEFSRDKGFNVVHGFYPDDVDASKRYDFIIFNDAFEHIPDIVSTVNASFNLLKDNGLLVINIPLSTGFFYRVADLLYKIGIKSYLNRLYQFEYYSPHFFYFNANNLNELLSKLNFEQVGYHKLPSIDFDKITERLTDGNDQKNTLQLKLLAFFIKLFQPIISYSQEDIGCFYFRKK